MIGEILRESYSKETLKKLYKLPIVTSCLFRSFDDFTQNIIFRFTTNGGEYNKKDLMNLINKNSEESIAKLAETLSSLEKLSIL
jgi:hypothetical protein